MQYEQLMQLRNHIYNMQNNLDKARALLSHDYKEPKPGDIKKPKTPLNTETQEPLRLLDNALQLLRNQINAFHKKS